MAANDGRMTQWLLVEDTRRQKRNGPLMHRGRLTRTRIAALSGAPASTAGYPLAVAKAKDPDLSPRMRKPRAVRRRGSALTAWSGCGSWCRRCRIRDSIRPHGPGRRPSGAWRPGWNGAAMRPPTGRNGDIFPHHPHGVFYQDTRILSRWPPACYVESRSNGAGFPP
ncbi:glycogen debranching N-terminal domain-containing protein [Arthrobacter sp. ISL-69]|uniref:glycogen debranching N-terminal domain-containing protein n=1 Tax=Arthrobacter sp. ISL-69 TaxID=2819113 RepID=UPI0037BE245F